MEIKIMIKIEVKNKMEVKNKLEKLVLQSCTTPI